MPPPAVLTSHAVTRVGMEGPDDFGWPAAIYLLERERAGSPPKPWRGCAPGARRRMPYWRCAST